MARMRSSISGYFPTQKQEDPNLQRFMPYRLELRARVALMEWLKGLAKR